MLANERYRIIKEYIKTRGAVTISELVHMFNVSTETGWRIFTSNDLSENICRLYRDNDIKIYNSENTGDFS
ncbi:MAG: hypothetical protein GX303_02480 [Clostridiales bacterium]|nr:hypothetical protein [Clostridiales bacterium]